MDRALRAAFLKKDLEKAIRESTDHYIEGKEKITYRVFEFDKVEGNFKFVLWPSTTDIEIAYVRPEMGYSDTGITIGSFDRDCFSMDQIVELTMILVDTYKGN